MKDEDGYYSKIPDSLVNEFKTKNGRLVYDGGGIEPDIKMSPRRYSRIITSLFTKYLIFDFATKFAIENPEIPQAEDFIITDEIYQDFVDFLADKDYDYTTACEEKLNELKETSEAEGTYEAIAEQYELLHKAMMHNKEEDLVTYKDEISELLKLEIVSRYYYQEGKIRASLHDDPEINRAIKVLEDPAIYQSVLDGSYTEDKAEKGDPKDNGRG